MYRLYSGVTTALIEFRSLNFKLDNYLIGRYLCVVDIISQFASWICDYTKCVYENLVILYQ